MKRKWIPFEGTTHKRPIGQFPVFPVGLKLAYDRVLHRVTNLHLERSHPVGGGYSLIWAIQVCAAPKGRVFQPFWSQIGYRFWTFWS